MNIKTTVIVITAFVIAVTSAGLYQFSRRRPFSPSASDSSPKSHKTAIAHGNEKSTSVASPMEGNVNTVQTAQATPGSTAQEAVTKLSHIEKAVDSLYQKAIAGLHLKPVDSVKLRSFLIERYLAAYDARDAVNELRPADPKALGKTIDAARAEVDQEIQTYFGPEIGEQIMTMIYATPYLNLISQAFEPEFNNAGVSLTAEQVLPLAKEMLYAYGSANNPNAIPNEGNVNPSTYLTKLDEDAISRAEKVLTPQQLTVFSRTISGRNKYTIKNS